MKRVSCLVLLGLLLAGFPLLAGCGEKNDGTPAADGTKRLRILLRDPQGQPIAHGQIHVVGMFVPPTTYETDSTGTAVAEVPGGQEVNVRFGGHVARFEGDRRRLVQRPLEVEVKDVPAKTTRLELRAVPMPADQSLTLQVLDPHGEPLPNAKVRLNPDPAGRQWRTTDAEGRVRLVHQTRTPIAVRLDVRPTRSRPWLPPPPRFVVPESQVESLRLTLGLVVDGRLIGVEGESARGGFVTIQAGDGPTAGARVGPEGRFFAVVQARPSDRLTLRSSVRDPSGATYEAALVDVPADRQPFELTLELAPRGADTER